MANKIKPDGLSQSKIYENGDLYNMTIALYRYQA